MGVAEIFVRVSSKYQYMYVGFVAVSGYDAGKFLKQMNLLEIIKASNEHSLEKSLRVQKLQSLRM